MYKKELIKTISRKSKLKKRQAEKALNALIELVGEELKQGRRFKITGLGTFEVKKRKGKVFCNPRTKQTLTLMDRKIPYFCVSTTLKKLVKKTLLDKK